MSIRDLDDAREEYKRIKGYDKAARKMVIGGIAAASASVAAVSLVSDNFGFGILGGILSVIVGVLLWMYVNTDFSIHERGDRLSNARARLRDAEARHEREMGIR